MKLCHEVAKPTLIATQEQLKHFHISETDWSPIGLGSVITPPYQVPSVLCTTKAGCR